MKNETDKFREATKPKAPDKKENKALTFKDAIRLLKGREKVFNGFESKMGSNSKKDT